MRALRERFDAFWVGTDAWKFLGFYFWTRGLDAVYELHILLEQLVAQF